MFLLMVANRFKQTTLRMRAKSVLSVCIDYTVYGSERVFLLIVANRSV